MFISWNLFRELASKCNTNDSALFEVEIQLDSVGKNGWALQATDGSFYSNYKEQNFDPLPEFAGMTVPFDLCLARGKEYIFTAFDDNGTGSSAYTLKLDGATLERIQSFGAAVNVTFPVPLSGNPTEAPRLTPGPTPARPSLRPTNPLDSFVTLEINFGPDTEDVSILIRTLVDLTETPQVVYDRPFDSFQESQYQDKRFVETIAVESGVVYSLEIVQRNQAVGIVSYSFYKGAEVGDDALFFTSSSVDGFEKTNFSVEPSSTPAPTSSPGPSFCFSGKTTVLTKNRGRVEMNGLQLGEEVLVEDGHFSPVYAFGHRDEHIKASFVQLLPSQLELSSNHMVHIQGKGFLPAHMVAVGDTLSNGSVVNKIRLVERMGLYNPFTVSGMIAVNGVLCSTYVSFQESDVFRIGNMRTGFTYQWLAHAALFPLRLWCHWIVGVPPKFENGWSTWVKQMYRVAKVFLSLNTSVAGVVVLASLVLLFCAFQMMEMIMPYMPSIILVCVIMATTAGVRVMKKKQAA